MAEIVNMPRLSDTMEEGTVAKWHKQVGDKIEEGDLLAEIETDKATMDFESINEGTILHIGIGEGETAPVDSVLAIVGEEGEDYKHLLGDDSGSDDQKSEEKSEPSTESKDAKSGEEDSTGQKSTSTSDSGASDSEPAPASVTEDGKRIKASPLARKLAKEKGVDISQIQGTGEGGRIVKRDIDQYEPSKAPAAAATEQPKPAVAQPDQSAPEGLSYEEVNVSQMRKTIAKRLSESKFSAPHFYLTLEIDMDKAIKARKEVNAIAESKISFNDFVIKAAAVALKKHPAVNSSWMGDKIRRNHDINIGVAVAVEEGLLVPVVRHADQKGLSTINGEVKTAAQKAHDKKLQPEDWEGNTFTISNLGMYGIEEFTAIINSPDSCIMAVGGIKQVPVVRDGAVVPGNIMKVTLSCDHRVVDGATGAAFLNTFKGVLENPMNMLL